MGTLSTKYTMFLQPREFFPAPRGYKILTEREYAGPTLESSRDRAVVQGRKDARHNSVPLIYRNFYRGKTMFVRGDYYHHGTIVTFVKMDSKCSGLITEREVVVKSDWGKVKMRSTD